LTEQLPVPHESAAKATELSRTEPDSELLNALREQTKRKHAHAFVPEKAQPKHKGNIKFPRLATFLNIVQSIRARTRLGFTAPWARRLLRLFRQLFRAGPL
jgi:hypothetical protein